MSAVVCCDREWTGKSYPAHVSHHARQWPSTESKFERLVDKGPGCWTWTGRVNNRGYGVVTHDRRPQYTHRVAWQLAYGPIPEGMGVLHRCDNPPCVRPEHLFLGDQKINGEDMAAKDRSTHGSKNPHAKLTEADVVDICQGGAPAAVLAERYGVHVNTIWRIRRGDRWVRVVDAAHKTDRIARLARRGECAE